MFTTCDIHTLCLNKQKKTAGDIVIIEDAVLCDMFCYADISQCEISTVLSRYGIKALSDLVQKTNVSPTRFAVVGFLTNNCTLVTA